MQETKTRPVEGGFVVGGDGGWWCREAIKWVGWKFVGVWKMLTSKIFFAPPKQNLKWRPWVCGLHKIRACLHTT